ncbi:hypothetical protein Nepgr_000232 [Nepenthes gracilis]|uniref:Uncharacterized protein n=1 Tax=Nepenthes gracilis TaxID=150966 RepID=A0AAD3P390_NEPGR|nr:hypothetical protein Nepgr_000232 [Nepenthes gracilis]
MRGLSGNTALRATSTRHNTLGPLPSVGALALLRLLSQALASSADKPVLTSSFASTSDVFFGSGGGGGSGAWNWGLEARFPIRDIYKDGGIFNDVTRYDRPNDGALVKVKLIGKPQDDIVFVREDHGDGDALIDFRAKEGLDRAVMTMKKREMGRLTTVPE